MSKTINKRAMFAEIHQDTREGGRSHEFSLLYAKEDGTLGFRARCRKSSKSSPGESKYRGNVSLNHILIIEDIVTGEFRNIAIDNIIEYNGRRVNHQF